MATDQTETGSIRPNDVLNAVVAISTAALAAGKASGDLTAEKLIHKITTEVINWVQDINQAEKDAR